MNSQDRKGLPHEMLSNLLQEVFDADSGSYVWHYQAPPWDVWGYGATEQMIPAEFTIGAKPGKALMRASKNGFFYVIDRVTGKLFSANKFAEATWATHIDLRTGGPWKRRCSGTRGLWL